MPVGFIGRWMPAAFRIGFGVFWVLWRAAIFPGIFPSLCLRGTSFLLLQHCATLLLFCSMLLLLNTKRLMPHNSLVLNPLHLSLHAILTRRPGHRNCSDLLFSCVRRKPWIVLWAFLGGWGWGPHPALLRGYA